MARAAWLQAATQSPRAQHAGSPWSHVEQKAQFRDEHACGNGLRGWNLGREPLARTGEHVDSGEAGSLKVGHERSRPGRALQQMILSRQTSHWHNARVSMAPQGSMEGWAVLFTAAYLHMSYD